MHREQRVIEQTRYHITQITRQADIIAALQQRFGWKAFVTHATPAQLSLQAAVLCYRHEYQVERIFHRLNPTTPLYLALCLSSLAMAKIGPVITLRHPCDQR